MIKGSLKLLKLPSQRTQRKTGTSTNLSWNSSLLDIRPWCSLEIRPLGGLIAPDFFDTLRVWLLTEWPPVCCSGQKGPRGLARNTQTWLFSWGGECGWGWGGSWLHSAQTPHSAGSAAHTYPPTLAAATPPAAAKLMISRKQRLHVIVRYSQWLKTLSAVLRLQG